MPPYTIEVFTDISDPELKAAWTSIEEQSDAFIQNRYDWCFIWWKHFGKGLKLHVVTVRDGSGCIVAVAPMCIRRHLTRRVLHSIPINYCDFYDFLIKPDCPREEALSCIVNYLKSCAGWDVVMLLPVNSGAVLSSELPTAGFSGTRLVGNVVSDISYSGWAEFLSSVSRNRRKITKKKLSEIQSRGEVKLEIITDPKIYGSLSSELEKMQEVRGELDRPSRTPQWFACVRETNLTFIERGRMRLFLLKLDDNIISYRIGIIEGKTYYDWSTSYDPAYAELSPGMVGLILVLKHLIENGFSEVNYMAGDYDYKVSYSPDYELRHNYRYLAYRRQPLNLMYLQWQYKIKPMVKQALERWQNLRRPRESSGDV